jgi:hypothetical protein
MAPYVREVKTASGATAVQVVWSSSGGSKKMDHIGSGDCTVNGVTPIKEEHDEQAG